MIVRQTKRTNVMTHRQTDRHRHTLRHSGSALEIQKRVHQKYGERDWKRKGGE